MITGMRGWALRLFLVFWTALGCALPLSVGAVEVLQGPSVQVDGATAAVVSWKTDVPCGTRVRYGTNPAALDQRAEGDVVTADHAITLTELKPATTYHFSVGTARVMLKSGTFVTPGGPGQTAVPPPATGPPIKPGAPSAKPTAESKANPAPSAAAPTTAPKPVVRKAPAARVSWGNVATLADHFERHGDDFGARDEEDYARIAWEFLHRALDESLPAKFDDTDDTIRVYDPATGAFAAYRKDGKTKTFFKPRDRTYFQRQPGKTITLKRPAPKP